MANYVKDYIEKISIKGTVQYAVFDKQTDGTVKCKFMTEDKQLQGQITIKPDKGVDPNDVKLLNLLVNNSHDTFGIIQPNLLGKMISIFDDDISKWDIGFEMEKSIFEDSSEIVSIQFSDGKYNCNYPLANSYVLKKVEERKGIQFPIKIDITKEIYDEINKTNRVIDSEDFILIPSEYNDKITILWSDTNDKSKRARSINYDLKLDYCKQQISKDSKFSSIMLREVLGSNRTFDKCNINLINGLVNIVFETKYNLTDEEDSKQVTIISDYILIEKR